MRLGDLTPFTRDILEPSGPNDAAFQPREQHTPRLKKTVLMRDGEHVQRNLNWAPVMRVATR